MADDFNNSGLIQLTFISSEADAVQLAKYDLERGTPYINLQGGISPKFYKSDSVFEKTFHVFYFEHGCTSPVYEFMEVYNFVIFNHLSATYGNKWMKKIRKDAIGFKVWKKKNN